MGTPLRVAGPLKFASRSTLILAALVGFFCVLSLFSSTLLEYSSPDAPEQVNRRRLIRSAAKAADAAAAAVAALKAPDPSVRRDGPRRAAEAVIDAWREAVPLLAGADGARPPPAPVLAAPRDNGPHPNFAPSAFLSLTGGVADKRIAAPAPPQPPPMPPVAADPLAPPLDLYVPLRSPFSRASLDPAKPTAPAANIETLTKYWPAGGPEGARGSASTPLRRGQLAAESFYAPRGVDGASSHTCARLGRLDFAPPKFTDESSDRPMAGLDGIAGVSRVNAAAASLYRRLEFGRWAMAWPRFIRREHRTWFENYAIVRWRRGA